MPATFRVRNLVKNIYADHKRAKAEKKAERHTKPAEPPVLVDRVNLSRQVLVRPS
jgi:hypothetical protein